MISLGRKNFTILQTFFPWFLKSHIVLCKYFQLNHALIFCIFNDFRQSEQLKSKDNHLHYLFPINFLNYWSFFYWHLKRGFFRFSRLYHCWAHLWFKSFSHWTFLRLLFSYQPLETSQSNQMILLITHSNLQLSCNFEL